MTDDIPQSPVKRRKLTDQKAQHTRPKRNLAKFMGLPEDVFIEVASYLHPRDLLRLSRSCRSFYPVLMAKSNRATWEMAFRNVPSCPVSLPACAPDLSLPEYASLAFDTFCLNCGTSPASHYDFSCRMRLCDGCKISREYREAGKRDLLDFIHACQISETEPPEISAICDLVPRTAKGLFCPVNALHLFQKCMKQKSKLGTDEYVEYLGKQTETAFKGAIVNNGLALQQWYIAEREHPAGSRKSQRRAKEEVIKNRRQNITSRLVRAGWMETDFPRGGTQYHAPWEDMMKRGKPMTDRSWLNYKDRFEEILRKTRSL